MAVIKKPMFGTEEASSLVKELRGTFNSGTTRTYEWRVKQLKNLLKVTDFHEKDIMDALHQDLSKPEFESFVTEVSMLKSAINLALKQLHHWMKPEKAKTSLTVFPSSAEIVPEPLGVVLVISAWNYPFCVWHFSIRSKYIGSNYSTSVNGNMLHTIPPCRFLLIKVLSLDPVVGAIAAGNAVMLKPSEIAPATSTLLAKLLEEYMDTSAIKVVEGNVTETNALLEQKWDKIMYTGNGRVGRIVMAAASKHLTPVLLELGGKSPVIVDSSINLQVATRRIIGGKWGSNNGQACISPDYIITTKDFAPKLIDSLKHELEKFYGKDPLESKDLSRIVNFNHFVRLSKLLDDDKVSGKIIYGGQRNETNLRIAPTILLDVPEDSLIMNEEIFGPLIPILTVDKVEDSFDIINKRSRPLAAYLFTDNKKLKEKFVESISAGGLLINDTVLHLAVDSLPFGGVGESGIGAYHGKHSFDAFTHKKPVLYRSFMGDAPARYPPYTPGKLRFLKALLNGDIIGIVRALFKF